MTRSEQLQHPKTLSLWPERPEKRPQDRATLDFLGLATEIQAGRIRTKSSLRRQNRAPRCQDSANGQLHAKLAPFPRTAVGSAGPGHSSRLCQSRSTCQNQTKTKYVASVQKDGLRGCLCCLRCKLCLYATHMRVCVFTVCTITPTQTSTSLSLMSSQTGLSRWFIF